MKVVLTATNHSQAEKELDVSIQYEGEDTWTFQIGKLNFTISNLTNVMSFLSDPLAQK